MIYKLLIAVDNAEERHRLHNLLTSHFGQILTIVQTSSGHEAISLFLRERPQISILDIDLQDMSGLAVAASIRETCKTCSLLFLSNSDTFAYAQQAIALRAHDFLLKPYALEKLLASISECLINHAHPDPTGLPLPATLAHEPESIAEEETTRLSVVREDIGAYIHKHYTEELSMKNVARAMNYSDAYFCKLFKQCFRVNFSTYLNQHRIQKAKGMIANPRISIKDVGLACGYSDPNYFARVFKRITGLTPSEYRLVTMERSLKE